MKEGYKGTFRPVKPFYLFIYCLLSYLRKRSFIEICVLQKTGDKIKTTQGNNITKQDILTLFSHIAIGMNYILRKQMLREYQSNRHNDMAGSPYNVLPFGGNDNQQIIRKKENDDCISVNTIVKKIIHCKQQIRKGDLNTSPYTSQHRSILYVQSHINYKK